MTAPPATTSGSDTEQDAARRERRLDLIALAVIAAAFLLPLRGLLHTPGPPMEEGFMLVFPERVLAGDIPNKDFLHLYGPGSLWVLAGVYEIFGTTLLTERLFGLLQETALVFGIYFLARRWGRTVGLSCALISLLFIISPHGLVAMPWVGAIALGVWGVHIGLRSRETSDPARARRLAVVSGLLFGFALLYRLDLVIAVTLAALALAPKTIAAIRKRFVIGLGIGLFPYLIHLATAGIENSIQGMVIDPILHLRGGRALPIPPSWNSFNSAVVEVADEVKLEWPIPALGGPQQVSSFFLGLVASLVVLAVVAVMVIRREPTSNRARALLVAAGFSVGLLPQAMQRPDPTHLAWVACVGMSLLPIAAYELLRRFRPDWGPRRMVRVAAGVVIAGFVLVIPSYTVRGYTDLAAQTFGEHVMSFEIRHRGRVFYNGHENNTKGANALLRAIEPRAEPGDRLFVGTKDLRQTPLSEVFFYFLLPHLPPATYYIEMDPGVANADDSGLADDVRSADFLVLSGAWDYWAEPNDSQELGSPEPNRVVRNKFCLVDDFGPNYSLYERCDRANSD